MSLKPICVPCQRFYRPEKTGVFFLEGAPIDNYQVPGKDNPTGWKPYKLWHGDLWKCHGCGHTIISGTGFNPVLEQHMTDFEQRCEAAQPIMQVNDC
jgi:hypothetical protein